MKRRSIEGMEKTLPPVIVGMSHPVIAQITEDDTVRREEKPGFRLLDELWEMGLNAYDCARNLRRGRARGIPDGKKAQTGGSDRDKMRPSEPLPEPGDAL